MDFNGAVDDCSTDFIDIHNLCASAPLREVFLGQEGEFVGIDERAGEDVERDGFDCLFFFRGGWAF